MTFGETRISWRDPTPPGADPMSRPLWFDDPDLDRLEARVIDRRPGAVRLDRSPFFPGGGGQLADRGRLSFPTATVEVIGLESDADGLWHRLDGDVVTAAIDPDFRWTMRELHTLAHVLNAIVHRRFDGALLTGAQLSADRTFRVDFDLPGVDPAELRGLDGALAEAIHADHEIRAFHMPWAEAAAVPGLFRSAAVSPPQDETGEVRIVEIVGLDRQACGGTHLPSTGRAGPARIVRVDNKGRRNRRIKVAVG
jgi:misacylated tRNA(Ala) deacylase